MNNARTIQLPATEELTLANYRKYLLDLYTWAREYLLDDCKYLVLLSGNHRDILKHKRSTIAENPSPEDCNFMNHPFIEMHDLPYSIFLVVGEIRKMPEYEN